MFVVALGSRWSLYARWVGDTPEPYVRSPDGEERRITKKSAKSWRAAIRAWVEAHEAMPEGPVKKGESRRYSFRVLHLPAAREALRILEGDHGV